MKRYFNNSFDDTFKSFMKHSWEHQPKEYQYDGCGDKHILEAECLAQAANVLEYIVEKERITNVPKEYEQCINTLYKLIDLTKSSMDNVRLE